MLIPISDDPSPHPFPPQGPSPSGGPDKPEGKNFDSKDFDSEGIDLKGMFPSSEVDNYAWLLKDFFGKRFRIDDQAIVELHRIHDDYIEHTMQIGQQIVDLSGPVSRNASKLKRHLSKTASLVEQAKDFALDIQEQPEVQKIQSSLSNLSEIDQWLLERLGPEADRTKFEQSRWALVYYGGFLVSYSLTHPEESYGEISRFVEFLDSCLENYGLPLTQRLIMDLSDTIRQMPTTKNVLDSKGSGIASLVEVAQEMVARKEATVIRGRIDFNEALGSLMVTRVNLDDIREIYAERLPLYQELAQQSLLPVFNLACPPGYFSKESADIILERGKDFNTALKQSKISERQAKKLFEGIEDELRLPLFLSIVSEPECLAFYRSRNGSTPLGFATAVLEFWDLPVKDGTVRSIGQILQTSCASADQKAGVALMLEKIPSWYEHRGFPSLLRNIGIVPFSRHLAEAYQKADLLGNGYRGLVVSASRFSSNAKEFSILVKQILALQPDRVAHLSRLQFSAYDVLLEHVKDAASETSNAAQATLPSRSNPALRPTRMDPCRAALLRAGTLVRVKAKPQIAKLLTEDRDIQESFLDHFTEFANHPVFVTFIEDHSLFKNYRLGLGNRPLEIAEFLRDNPSPSNPHRAAWRCLGEDKEDRLLRDLQTVEYLGRDKPARDYDIKRILIITPHMDQNAQQRLTQALSSYDVEIIETDDSSVTGINALEGDVVYCCSLIPHERYRVFKARAASNAAPFFHFNFLNDERLVGQICEDLGIKDIPA